MICVDTSALMAIVLDEPQSDACIEAMSRAPEIVISAGTLTEALIVAGRRSLGGDMAALLGGFEFRIVVIDEAAALRAAEAHENWGKGKHAARLNYGDCFAYEVAQRYGCPLLFVGDDFTRTDVRSAL